MGARRIHVDRPIPIRPTHRQRAAQQRHGSSRDSNYVRNSVKAVVDAYTGDVTFYVVDNEDPILAAWQSAFPDLFTPIERCRQN